MTKSDNVWQNCSLDYYLNAYLLNLFIYKGVDAGNQLIVADVE